MPLTNKVSSSSSSSSSSRPYIWINPGYNYTTHNNWDDYRYGRHGKLLKFHFVTVTFQNGVLIVSVTVVFEGQTFN